MLDLIKEYIIKFTDFVCGWPLFTLLIGGGIFLFIYSRALPLRKLGMAVSSLKMKKKGEGQVSSFQALMNTISSTVGMGNIAGVAIALCVGGPGAIFWMWVSALLGMATKFFEGTLAVMYKGKDDKGVAQGGPMFVLTRRNRQEDEAVGCNVRILRFVQRPSCDAGKPTLRVVIFSDP